MNPHSWKELLWSALSSERRKSCFDNDGSVLFHLQLIKHKAKRVRAKVDNWALKEAVWRQGGWEGLGEIHRKETQKQTYIKRKAKNCKTVEECNQNHKI